MTVKPDKILYQAEVTVRIDEPKPAASAQFYFGPDYQQLLATSTEIITSRNLALEVVAEGVETATQLAILRDLGCRCVEGALALRAEQTAALRAPLAGAEAWVADLLTPRRPAEGESAQ